MNEQNQDPKPREAACGPGCHCGANRGRARAKWLICALVALAAAGVVAARVSRTQAANHKTEPQGYAAAVPATVVEDAKPAANLAEWPAPLNALADLNQAAADTDGVFVVLPSADARRTAEVQAEVAAAAAAISARGSRMGQFLLSRDSQEYESLSRQVGTPAVLALCKGRGMSSVPDKDVTQGNLLKAFVAASRPSGCGPSGCGPRMCN